MWSVRFKNEKCILLVADYAKVHRTVGRHGEPYESASEKPLVVWTVFGTCSFMVHPSCNVMLMWEFISKDYLQIIIIALQAHFVQEMGRYLGLQNLLSKDKLYTLRAVFHARFGICSDEDFFWKSLRVMTNALLGHPAPRIDRTRPPHGWFRVV